MNTANGILTELVENSINQEIEENDSSILVGSEASADQAFTLKAGPSKHSPTEHLTIEDAKHYMQVFQTVFGVLHPLPHLKEMDRNVTKLVRVLKRSIWTRPAVRGQVGLLAMFKVVLAIGLEADGGVQTRFSRDLFESVRPVVSDAALSEKMNNSCRFLLLVVVCCTRQR